MKEDIENTNKQEEPDDIKRKSIRRYTIVVLLLLTLVFGIIFSASKTIFNERDEWIKVAEQQKRPNLLIFPNRGSIYSANGEMMATSVPMYYTYIDFAADGFLRDTFLHSKANGVDSLSYYLAQKFKDRSQAGYKQHLMKGFNQKKRQYPIIQRQISFTALKELKTFPFLRFSRFKSGLYDKEMVRRQKPYGSLASRTIGDIYGELEAGGQSKGKNGLELQYDSLLRGEAGLATIRRLGGTWTSVSMVEPKDGVDIYTTIDIDIQDITEKSLTDKLKEIDAESGTVIVMEVETGEVKAITNMARIREGVYAETKNHAVADEIEPGSTFKVASMLVALDDGLVKPSDSIDTGNGIFMYKGARMTDHNAHKGGYHVISAEEAIWFSSNIGVAKVILRGYEKNPQKFVDGLKRVGMDADLKLEIPGAGQAKIRDTKSPYWSKTSLPWMSFGYETQIPPINTLTFFNAVANNGKMMRPYFTRSIERNGEVIQKFKPEVIISSIASGSALKDIQAMLIGVVEEGTGKPAYSPSVRIAGKTGTAQIAVGGSYTAQGKQHQVSFCGYFPADKPVYSAICVIRRPRIGYPSGGTMSGEVVRNLAERIYSNKMPLDIKKTEKDSTAVLIPDLKGGKVKAMKYVLNELNIDFKKDSIDTEWAVSRQEDRYVQLMGRKTIEHLVPNVVGMGAKDALYLLETAGLRVSLSGAGKVRSQSISPGNKVVKGQTISLTLK